MIFSQKLTIPCKESQKIRDIFALKEISSVNFETKIRLPGTEACVVFVMGYDAENKPYMVPQLRSVMGQIFKTYDMVNHFQSDWELLDANDHIHISIQLADERFRHIGVFAEDSIISIPMTDAEEILKASTGRESVTLMKNAGTGELEALLKSFDGFYSMLPEDEIFERLNNRSNQNFTAFSMRSDMPETLLLFSSPIVQYYEIVLRKSGNSDVAAKAIIKSCFKPHPTRVWEEYKKYFEDAFPGFDHVEDIIRIQRNEAFERANEWKAWEKVIITNTELPF